MKYLSMCLLIILCSCGNEQPQDKTAPPPPKEELIQRHKNRIQTEEDRIDAYVRRRDWEMKESGTGLRYLILEQGSGPNAETGMTAVVKYRISLLNGRECYASKEGESESFVIGEDAVESGLHEGIQYLNKGASAILITPPHLAHGLIGDREKIPANATLVFEITLIDLK